LFELEDESSTAAMGKTHAQKMKSRDGRLGKMARSDRSTTSANIKRKEGRVLNANEKHAVKMKGGHGDVLRAWEVLRTSADKLDEKVEAMKAQKKALVEGAGGEVSAKDDKAMVTKADCDSATGVRDAAVTKTMALITENFAALAKTPVVSRVIQSCIKFGSPDQRNKILTWMSSDFAAFCTDAFAHFIVEALIRHASLTMFRQIVALLIPAMPVVVQVKCGVKVVHSVYSNKMSNTLEKNLIILGIFKDSVQLMKTWPGYPVLEDILEHKSPQQKRILATLFGLTDKLVGKGAADLPFVQRLLCALFRRGVKHEVEELAVTIKSHIKSMLPSKEGATLASVAFAVMQPRSRKEALRDLAGGFLDAATNKFSAPFVARVFDLTYDPQMAMKFLVAPFLENIEAIVASPFGCRVLLHMLTPDAARKEKVLFPSWTEHNLYSRGNTAWNHHTWLDADMEEETVEICAKSAETSHAVVIAPIVKKFVAVFCGADSIGSAEPKSLDGESRATKGFVGCIASEVMNLVHNEPTYAAALGLDAQEIAGLQAAKSNKKGRDAEPEIEVAPVRKSARVEKTPAKKAAVAATPAKATPAAARKSATVAATPATVKKTPAAAPRDADAPMEASARATPGFFSAATPMAKKTPKSVKKASATKFADDDDEEDVAPAKTPAKAKATPAKSATKSTKKDARLSAMNAL
jgi:pumilio family protein 6